MSWIERVGKKYRAVRRGEQGREAGPLLPTDADARRWAVRQGWETGPTRQLRELMRTYLTARSHDARPIAPKTAVQIEYRLTRLFDKRGWTTTDQLSLGELDRWRAEHKGRGQVLLQDYLLAMLRWASYHLDVPIDHKVLELKKIRPRRAVKRRELLSDADVARVIKTSRAFGPDVHALVHYLATYGARPITACKLRVGAVNFRKGTLVVDAKHSGEWEHPLRPDTLELFGDLCEARKPSDPLFSVPQPSVKGGRPFEVEPDGGWKIGFDGAAASLCRWYLRNIGREATPHLPQIYHLKRYAITRMLDAGMSPKDVAEFTGHLSMAQVLEYARTSDDKLVGLLDRLPATEPSKRRRAVAKKAP